MSASAIFLIQIPFVMWHICSIFFWKSTKYCPKNTWRYHSSSSVSQTLTHPPNKLFVAYISEGPKELSISNIQSLNVTLPCLILRCLYWILILVMLQAPKQPKFFQKYSSFRKYLQYKKRPQKMPVKKFVLAQTFIKFKVLQILPINKDCRFTNKYMNFLPFSKRREQPPRNVLQKS